MLKEERRPDKQKVTFTYDALGRRLSKHFSRTTTHFLWSGNETGRYISEDPIGFLSGEPNFFAYVSDTNAWVDLLGLSSKVYGEKDGKELEDDIENLLIENDISHTRNRKIYDESGKVLGEIDIETDSHIIETTVSKDGKHKQIRKYKTDVFNPENKDVILYGPNYKNLLAKESIQNEGVTVVNSPDELIKIIK